MSEKLTIGGKYNWKNQPERLVYLGYNFSGNGYWHQFAKIESPSVVWCEVKGYQLSQFEETAPVAEPASETRAIHVTISVPADWANRLDMQHILEREIRDDRWSWNWPAPAPAVDERIADSDSVDLAAASNGSPCGAWVPVIEHMPSSGVTVLACYTNRAGNVRRIRAEWVAAKTIESDAESEISEYDDATDCFYDPEGWYEKIDNWGDYSSVAVVEGEVTHWMPLPAPPQLNLGADGQMKKD